MRDKLYVVQDKRSYVGNDLLFWAKGSNGYTTDLSRAEIFTEEEIQEFLKPNARETDIVWPYDYILAHARRAVDSQHVNISFIVKPQSVKD